MPAEELEVNHIRSKAENLNGFSARSRTSESVYPLACCAVTLLCVLLAQPYAGTGFNDDWSYSRVALELAQTGRVHYNGWGPAMQLFQAAWGAAWIRLFGFSFDLLRIITIP